MQWVTKVVEKFSDEGLFIGCIKKDGTGVQKWTVELQVNGISKNLKLDTIAFLGRQMHASEIVRRKFT